MRSGGGSMGAGSLMPFGLDSIPVVRGLLAALVILFLIFFLAADFRGTLANLLAFRTGGSGDWSWLTRPWALLTYPLLVGGPIELLLGGYWLYIVGGSLERSWGSRNFGALFAAFTAIGALGLLAASQIFDLPIFLLGLFLPLAAVTVAWAALDPELPILVWGLLPVKLKWIGVITVALLYFNYGFSMGRFGPIAALFALCAPAAAWIYVRKLPRLNIGFRAPRPRGRSGFEGLLKDPHPEARRKPRSPAERLREREETERLRRLLGDNEPPSRPN